MHTRANANLVGAVRVRVSKTRKLIAILKIRGDDSHYNKFWGKFHEGCRDTLSEFMHRISQLFIVHPSATAQKLWPSLHFFNSTRRLIANRARSRSILAPFCFWYFIKQNFSNGYREIGDISIEFWKYCTWLKNDNKIRRKSRVATWKIILSSGIFLTRDAENNKGNKIWKNCAR